MSKEDMIKEAVEEAKAEAAKMEDEAAADEQDEAAETKGSVEEEASKETEESQDTKDTESKEKKKFFAKKKNSLKSFVPKLFYDEVTMVGLEPTWSCPRRILNPLRLPIPSHRHYSVVASLIFLNPP